MNDLQISIKGRAENLDGRKDFRMKIVDSRLRMKSKLEGRYAAPREDLPDTFKFELSSLVKYLVSKIWKSWDRQARSCKVKLHL